MPMVLSRGQRRCMPALLAGAIELALVFAVSPAIASGQDAAQAASTIRSYQLPAQSLTTAIQQYSHISGVQVIFASAEGQGLRSNAVHGEYSAEQALQLLLQGSGLQVIRIDQSSVRLQRQEQAGIVTGKLSIEGTIKQQGIYSSDANATEGSGRYTAGKGSTANKLELSQRQTPQSMTIVSREQMDDMAAHTLTEVMGEVTGVVVSSLDTERTNYMSRGYSIATYQVDGVNTAYSNGYVKLVSDPAIYDRIEVLRGAAGHTLGAGDPGGTINQVRKRPGDVFAANVNMSTGRWNNHRLEFDVGGPIAWDGRVRGRMVAVKQTSDSFRDWYTSDKEVFYGIVEVDLSDSTMLTLGYDHQRPENSGVTWGTIPYWLSDGSLANMPRSFNPAARWSQWNVEQQNTFVRIEQMLGDDWTLRLSYNDDEQEVYGDRWFGGSGYFPNPDGTGKSAWYGGGNNYGEAKSWDFDVNGVLRLFGRQHQLNVGYHREETENHSPASVTTYPDDFFTTIPDWRNWDGIVPEYSRSYLDYDSNYTLSEQSAFYLSARIDLADRLKAIVGGRLGKWQSYSYTYLSSGAGYSRSGYEIDDVFTPYAALLYDIGQHLTAYVSYTDIFTPQNYRDFNGDYLDPVEGNHYEIGLKGEFFDGGLNTNISLFRSQKDHLAEVDDAGMLEDGSFDSSAPPEGYSDAGYRFIPGTEELAYRSTGKGNKMRGYELQAQGAISENWNISAGFSHTNMEDKNGAQINTYLPRQTLRLRTNYRLPGRWQKLSIGGGVTWQSETWANVNNVPTGSYDSSGKAITERRRIVQPDFYLLNLSANYRVNDNLALSFNINNLLDKEYFNRVGFYSGVMYGTPRDYRLNLRYRF